MTFKATMTFKGMSICFNIEADSEEALMNGS